MRFLNSTLNLGMFLVLLAFIGKPHGFDGGEIVKHGLWLIGVSYSILAIVAVYNLVDFFDEKYKQYEAKKK